MLGHKNLVTCILIGDKLRNATMKPQNATDRGNLAEVRAKASLDIDIPLTLGCMCVAT